MINIYEERGALKGQRALLLHMMELKFGALSETIAARIQSIQTQEEIESLADQFLEANSLKDMGFPENEA